MIEDMLHFQMPIFLTFVVMLSLSVSMAAPQLENLNSDNKIEPLSEVSDPLLESAALSPTSSHFNAIKGTLSWLVGDVGQTGSSDQQTAWGISYSHTYEHLLSREYQAHWLSGDLAWFQWSERQLIDQYALFEPYFKYGLSFFADPEDGLSSITRLENFRGSAAVGMLDIGPWNSGITFEMGLHLGLPGLAFHVQTGWQTEF